MDNTQESLARPEILAPAGGEDSFLAAIAAGADGIYLGLKSFSARMEADNFSIVQLAKLVELAHVHACRVYVAMNVMLKPQEINACHKLVKILAGNAVDGLIVQDLAMPCIARDAGFEGSLILSTLANVCNPSALEQAAALDVSRIVLPRELSLDEIRIMGEACPENLELECFVQGALCYCVSGRCYWSSYMGGKSGLRGRCVQPCRRMYAKNPGKIQKGEGKPTRSGERYFSCQDLQLGEIVKTLLTIPKVTSWKIEGRKKGPHYVYHAVTAYKILRDFPKDAQKRKMAMEILELALGRPGVKGRFLPQKKIAPMSPGGQTSSGRLAGHVRIEKGACIIKPHYELLPRDYLRIGTQDEHGHSLLPVSRHTPKGGTLVLRVAKHKTPRAGTPVYLVDRREPELEKLLGGLRTQLESIPDVQGKISEIAPMPLPQKKLAGKIPDMFVSRGGKTNVSHCLAPGHMTALWLNAKTASISPHRLPKTFFWLPPVTWPENEKELAELISRLIRGGAKNFVCNTPWQRTFFPKKLPDSFHLIAGPFCNIANPIALETLRQMHFCAAFVSPELDSSTILRLPGISPIPLGFVAGGCWPVGISRFGLVGVDTGEPFASPKGEIFWARNHGGNIWIYPAWPLNLCSKKQELASAGYSFFAWLDERRPENMPAAQRPGLFNWENPLL